jgi:hypothetical protein
MENNDLSEVIGEIFKEKTVVRCGFGNIYFKHFDQLESRSILSKKNIFIEEAVSKGLETEKQSLDRLIKEGFWEEEKENQVKKKLELIERMTEGLTKIQLPSKRDQHKKLIKAEEKSLEKLTVERKKLMGLTAESFAESKVNKTFFDSITFLDEDFKIPAFKNLDYDEREKEIEILKLQSNFFEKFSDENISKSALCPFFSPYLNFCEDVLGLFGKPAKDLTAFQLKLLTYGRTFLNIFKNSQKKIPQYVAKDPELLLEFWESQTNQTQQKRTKASEGDGATTYFGATERDLEEVKQEGEEVISLKDQVKKQGGTLDMEQMMKLHGV